MSDTSADTRQHSQAVDILVGELSDEVMAPRLNPALDRLAREIHRAYEELAPVVLSLAGPEAASQRQAHEALVELLKTKATEEIHGANAANDDTQD